MSLLNAPEYDEKRARRRVAAVWGAIAAVLVVAALLFWFRNWTYEHTVDQFFTAIEHNDMERAFALYTADPDWKAHPQQYKGYPYGQFVLDWGASGDWGIIRSHHVDCAARIGTGVIVATTINDRPERSYIWVEKKDKTLTVAPSQFQLQCSALFAQ
jgi:hypothetical protein